MKYSNTASFVVFILEVWTPSPSSASDPWALGTTQEYASSYVGRMDPGRVLRAIAENVSFPAAVGVHRLAGVRACSFLHWLAGRPKG